VEIKVIRPWIC